MTSPAAGSAHHQPSQVFRPTPSRAAAEVNEQKAESATWRSAGVEADEQQHAQAEHADRKRAGEAGQQRQRKTADTENLPVGTQHTAPPQR
jgi:hypothetical protein